MNTMNHKEYNCEEKTLCERCQNACGRCAWSAFGMPVNGWTATKVKLNAQHNREPLYIETYRVFECPLFNADAERHTPNIRSDRVMVLAYAILFDAVSEYAYMLKRRSERGETQELNKRIKHAEQWFLSESNADLLNLCGIEMDPQLVLDAIKVDPLGVIERLRVNYWESNETNEPKRRGRKPNSLWDNPKLQIRNAERKY